MSQKKMNKFLSAINKFAEEQRVKIRDEGKAFRKKELEKAEREALKEAYQFIQVKMNSVKNEITSKIFKKEFIARKKIFSMRKKILENVFFRAKDKILTFSKTDDYKQKLSKNVYKILENFKQQKIVFFVKKEDFELLNTLNLGSEYKIKISKDITLGGIKAFVLKTKIVIDETLDTKLENQREWFLEHSGL